MLTENYKIVPCGIDVDFHSATDNVCDSINMKNFHKATYLIQLVDIGTASPLLLAYSGTSDAARTSALPFKYAFASATTGSASCDVLGDWTECEATGLTLTHGTYDNYLLVVEINASAMDIANGEEWLTLDFQDTADAGATGQAIVIAVLEPRYKTGESPTCLT